MKKPVLILAIIHLTLCCFSQRTTLVGHYVIPTSLQEEKMLVIKMPFGEAGIIDISGDTAGIEMAVDIFVEVVCTDYPTHTSLLQLNKKRIGSFLQRFPFLTYRQLTQISFLRQLEGAEKEKAVGMFHGLVVRYRPKQTFISMKVDLAKLDVLVDLIERDSISTIKKTGEDRDSILRRLALKKGLLYGKNTGPAKYASQPYDMCVTGYVGYRHFPDDSSINISPRQALRKKLISKAAYKAYDWTPLVTLFFRRIDEGASKTIRPVVKEIPVTDTIKETRQAVIPDSTLLKIFARMNWQHYTIVGDVTVSMYPYSAQLLLWLKLHGLDNTSNSFVFFNDGNEMPDAEKKTGSTGGIFLKDCHSFEQVKKLITETMEKGSGGDRPENDVEALLAGENEFPQNDFQVLIADNRAPVKDKVLSGKLTKPVRVILCGANEYNINTDYLDLARQTKGSVHLMEKDLGDLATLQEGAVLAIGKKNYKIEKGHFVEIDDLEK